MEVTGFKLYRVRCLLNEDSFFGLNLSLVKIAIVDIRDNKQRFYFQKPLFFDRGKPKKDKLVNYVHTLRNVDDSRFAKLINWIRLNKEFGVDKIRFCAIELADRFVTRLRGKFSDYIDIVRHEVDIERVCKNMHSKDTKKECADKFKLHFDVKKLLGLHDKICTNDCFMSYKYVYRYLSNYDVDEFIFPRRFETNYFNADVARQKSCAKAYENFSKPAQKRPDSTIMTDYMERLVEKYGRNVSHFRFENYLVLKEYSGALKKLENKDLSKVQVNTTWETILKYETPDAALTLLRSKADLEYFDSLRQMANFTKCVNNKFMSPNASLFRTKWLRLLASPVYVQPGKSIYNTDLVESLNQHTTRMPKIG